MAKAIAVASSEERQNKMVAGVTGWWERTTGFLTDVRNEMRKVHSPSRKEVRTTTFVVIFTVFAFGLYFYLVDSAIGALLDRLLHKLATRS
jgi:preprotein translocase subunit SecE